MVSADPCPGCSYAIGETGPAGGIVFYVTDDGTHGLESAPSDQGYTGWGCSGTDLAGAEGVAIGTGAQNTLDIIAACQIEGIPAYIADNFSLNGFDDWFLPSRDELNLLYANLHIAGLGEFTWNSYWSSSEIDADLAWAQFFASGAQAAANKIINRGVRAIRAF